MGSKLLPTTVIWGAYEDFLPSHPHLLGDTRILILEIHSFGKWIFLFSVKWIHKDNVLGALSHFRVPELSSFQKRVIEQLRGLEDLGRFWGRRGILRHVKLHSLGEFWECHLMRGKSRLFCHLVGSIWKCVWLYLFVTRLGVPLTLSGHVQGILTAHNAQDSPKQKRIFPPKNANNVPLTTLENAKIRMVNLPLPE